MFKRLLELAQIHGENMTVDILEKAGITKKDLPRILHDIIAKNDEANIYLIMTFDRAIIDLNYINEDGLTPIQVATNLKRWDHVVAIANAENIDHVKARTGYALLEAVKANETFIVMRILKSCCETSYQSSDNGYTALHWAIIKNNEIILRGLLAKGVNSNLRVKQTTLPLQLVLNAKVVNPNLIAILCQHTADIAPIVFPDGEPAPWSLVQLIFDNDKRTHLSISSKLLYEAVTQNNQAMVAYMLGKGGNFTHGKNALQRALDLKYYHFVKFALESVPAKDLPLDQILPLLAQAEQWDLVTKIIQAKPLLNATVNNNATIHILIAKAKWDILELLLQQGPDVNLKNGDNKTALEMAVSQGDKQAVTLLCQHGADVAVVIISSSQQKRWNDIKMILDCDKRNHDPLLTNVFISAAMADQTDFIMWLLSRGIDIESALKEAAKNKQWQALKFLIMTSPNDHKTVLTSLLVAVIEDNQPEVLTCMLERGANAVELIKDGNTAANIAANNSKWPCVLVIAKFLKQNPDDNANFGSALLEAAAQKQWDIVKELCRPDTNFRWHYTSNGRYAAHFIIEENQNDLLLDLLDAKYDVNMVYEQFESPLECAERVNNHVARNLLIQHGAKHHNKLIREAEKANWNGLLNLISEHYEIRPNQNETENDKKFILGKLLHIAVTKKSIETFRALILLGADVLVEYKDSNLLLLIVKEEAWAYLDILIAEKVIQQFSKPTLSAAMMKLYTTPPKNLSLKDSTVLCPFVDLSYVEPTTGNSFVHFAIVNGWDVSLKSLIENKAPQNIKNAKSQLPITLLLTLIKEGKIKNEDAFMACFPAEQEYADALKFETIDENLGEDNIKKSRNLSRNALLQRYPNLDVEKAIKDYRIFLGHLPDKFQDYKNNSEYKLDDSEVRKDIALAWVAACDANALPECEAAIKSDPERVKGYVELRKLALAEKLYQAKVETRENVGSCGNGTKTKAIEALNHAHPDVIICYSKSLTEQSAREHALPIIRKKAQELLGKMTFKDQRVFAKEYFSEDDDNNNESKLKLYQELSATVEAELKPLYGEILPNDELKKLISVENLQEVEFTPIRELGELIFKIRRLNTPESSDLQQQALQVFSSERDESIFSAFEDLQKSYQDYTNRVSAKQLGILSILNTADKKPPADESNKSEVKQIENEIR